MQSESCNDFKDITYFFANMVIILQSKSTAENNVS